uniref:ZP domain-containing protein n=1 Tax=Panagrolaimus sp. PS1159 TaxID=55785 RepID=A0AC35GBW2_9BILA
MQFWLRISVIFITLKIYETRLTSLDEAKVLGTPIISCSTKWVTLSFETSVPFQGRVFIEDMAYDSRCSAQYTSNLEKNATFRYPMRPCTNNDKSLSNDKISMFVANVKINFHPIFILQNSKTYRVTCTDTNNNGLIEEDGTANTICQHNIIRSKNDLSSKLTVGKTIYHKWTCSSGYEIDKFAILLRKCDVISKTREVAHLIDENGCIIDELLLNSLKYSPDKLEITAETKIFKFIDESEMRFTCDIVLIPKDTPTTKIKVPKCTISREDIRRRVSQKASPTFYFDQNDELYRDFATIMKDEKLKETRTITEWFNVQDLPVEVEVFKASIVMGKINKTLNNEKIYKEKLMEQDVLKKFMPNQLPYNKTKSAEAIAIPSISMKQIFNGQRGGSEKSIYVSSTFPKPDLTEFGRQALSLDKVEEFQDLTPTISNKTSATNSSKAALKPSSTIEDFLELEKIEKILSESNEEKNGDLKENMLEIDSSRLQSSEFQAHVKDEIAIEHKSDWRLDDVILNKTDDIVINCASEFSKNNQSTYSIHPEALSCTWRSLNVALLLWSLGTLIIWTILIGAKVHQVIWSDSRSHDENCPIAAARQQHQNMQTAYYHPSNYHGRYGSTFYPHSFMT